MDAVGVVALTISIEEEVVKIGPSGAASMVSTVCITTAVVVGELSCRRCGTCTAPELFAPQRRIRNKEVVKV